MILISPMHDIQTHVIMSVPSQSLAHSWEVSLLVKPMWLVRACCRITDKTLLRASYRYSIYRKYRYQHIDTITGIPIGAFSIRIDIILTVVLWSRLHQGWSSTELFTKDINRHFLHLIRKAAYRLRLRCVNWQSKQTGPLSLPAGDSWHQEGPVYKASLVAVIVIAVPLVDVAAGIITLPMDSHACQEFHAVANFRWVLHKRSSFVVVLTWFTYGYSCPSMANIQLSSEFICMGILKIVNCECWNTQPFHHFQVGPNIKLDLWSHII